jgi:hypothetical protein
MKKVKIIMTAIAVFTVVGSSLASNVNAKRGNLCLYQKNGSTCPITRIVNNGVDQVPNAHLRTNNGACPSAVAVANCVHTVFIGINP